MGELGERVDAANREAIERMLRAEPIWTGVVRARHAAPRMAERELLLAGPPTSFREASSLQRTAVVEAAELEGWAQSPAEAAALAEAGEISLASAHDRGGVVPAGLAVSPSTPVLSLEDRTTGLRCWSALEAGPSGAARALQTVAARRESRAFARDVLGPALDRAIDVGGGLELAPLVARALCAGDDLGARHEALSGLLAQALARRLVRAGIPRGELGLVLDHLGDARDVVAAASLGAAKVVAESAAGVPFSTVVTAMAQGGRRFGVRVAALGGRWCVVDLGPVAELEEDLGDRPIVECVGLGAFAIAAAPARLAAFSTPREAMLEAILGLRSITLASHPAWTVPLLGFEGVRLGVDVRRVVETGLVPLLSPADPTASDLRPAPAAAFAAAVEAFAEAVGVGGRAVEARP